MEKFHNDQSSRQDDDQQKEWLQQKQQQFNTGIMKFGNIRPEQRLSIERIQKQAEWNQGGRNKFNQTTTAIGVRKGERNSI